MVLNKQKLLYELENYVCSHIEYAQYLKTIPEEELQKKRKKTSWSILECIEHLNRYAAFYNEEIDKRIRTSRHQNSSEFNPGYLGNKFAIDMLPKENMKTMNTFKSKNPIYSILEKNEVLDSFIGYQNELLELLKLAKDKNLTKTKTSITLPLLKFRLGDTFRFVIYHNERHIVQAQKIKKE